MAKAKPIESQKDLEKYLVREMKKIRKAWLHYCNRTEGQGYVKDKAYLSLTVFRNSIMFNNDPESSKYFNLYEEVKDEESVEEN